MTSKKVSPQEMLKITSQMAENLTAMKKRATFVGLPAEKVGGKVYGDGMTVIQIGATHEYGATIHHPGGTPYKLDDSGKAVFLPKGSKGVGVTQPHVIEVPQRSFLRTPFAVKRAELNAGIAKQFEAASLGRVPTEVALGRIGVIATNIAKGAFTTQGYGVWRPITAATKARKGSSQTLIDTGILRGSVTWVIRDAT